MSQMLAATFGDLLRQTRKRAGMTQGDLAAATGYSISFVCALEQNRRLPDVQMVLQQFVPALGLQEEPNLATHLVELAARVRGERLPVTITRQRETQIVVTEENTEEIVHLPAPPTPLIGREQEVRHLGHRLVGHSGRLLTLVGPPGIGKTRLALAVAAQVHSHYRDGTVFVPLAAIRDPALVASTLVTAVKLQDSSSKPPKTRLIEHLRRKELLLVLDNFEQVIVAGPLIAELLAACPGLCVLVTSRERLHLRAEQRYKVQPLALAASVELFVQRAQAVESDFSLTSTNRPTVEAICAQLDCLPLAIELIAAHIELYLPQVMLARLQDRGLDLLNGGPSDAPEHQRTLRNAIHRSYSLLNEQQAALFRILGVFVGGFDLTVIAHWGYDEAALHALIHKSLVKVEEQTDGRRRFFLLETLRQYAREQLASTAELADVQQQHAVYFLALAQNAEFHFGDSEEKTWYDLVEIEHDNLRTALRWSLLASPAIALALANGLREFWYKRGHYTEGQAWLIQALSQNSTSPPSARGKALHGIGRLALTQGHYVEATGYFEESLHVYQQLGDRHGIANALSSLGLVALYQNDPARAKPFFAQSLLLRRSINHQKDIARSLNNLGLVAMYQGDFVQAKLLFKEKLAIDRTNRNESGTELTLGNLGYCELHQGEPSAAKAYFLIGMQMALRAGDRESIAFYLEGFAEIAGLYEEAQESKWNATRLLSASSTLRKALNAPLPPIDHQLYEHTMFVLRTCLDDARFDVAWTEGQMMTLDEAVAEAIATTVCTALDPAIFAEAFADGRQMLPEEAFTMIPSSSRIADPPTTESYRGSKKAPGT